MQTNQLFQPCKVQSWWVDPSLSSSCKQSGLGDAFIFVKKNRACIDETKVQFQVKQSFSWSWNGTPFPQGRLTSPCQEAEGENVVEVGESRYHLQSWSWWGWRACTVANHLLPSSWQACIHSQCSPGIWPLPPEGLGRPRKERQGPGSGQADTTERKQLCGRHTWQVICFCPRLPVSLALSLLCKASRPKSRTTLLHLRRERTI